MEKPIDSENHYCKKVSFATEADADFYINKLKKTSSRKVVPTRAYLCEECLNWHLTHVQHIDIPNILAQHERTVRALKKQIADKEKTIDCLNRAIIEFRTQPAKKKAVR